MEGAVVFGFGAESDMGMGMCDLDEGRMGNGWGIDGGF